MRLMLAVLVVGVAATPALSDVVELTTGERIEGNPQEVSGISAVIEVAGTILRIERGKVRAVYLGAAPSQSTAPIPSTSQEALRALKALQSAVTAGLTYRDYGPRVADAKDHRRPLPRRA